MPLYPPAKDYVPSTIQDGETFTIPARRQWDFGEDITIAGTGSLVVNGDLVDTSTPSYVWRIYNPYWSASTTNPILGNGTLVGKYCQIGSVVHYSIYLVFGTTTVAGSGAYKFSLPVTGVTPTPYRAIGQSEFLDSGASFYIGSTRYFDGATVTPISITTAAGAGADVTNISPFTFGALDEINITGTYEAA